MVVGGKNRGRVGTVISREKHKGSFDIGIVRDAAGNEFATRCARPPRPRPPRACRARALHGQRALHALRACAGPVDMHAALLLVCITGPTLPLLLARSAPDAALHCC